MIASTLILPRVDFSARTRVRDLFLIIAGSVALAVVAQARVALPFAPVPLTGQTLAVGLLGLLLGSRRAAMAASLYLAEGACGAPVFSGLSGGLGALAGITGGYLVAMPAAAFLCGALAERGWDRTPYGAFAAMLSASALVLAAGTLWLSLPLHGLPRAAMAGLYPFVPGEVLKALAVCAAFPSMWALKRRLS